MNNILTNDGWKSADNIKLNKDLIWTNNFNWQVVGKIIEESTNNILINTFGNYNSIVLPYDSRVIAITKQQHCPKFTRSLREWIGSQKLDKIKLKSTVVDKLENKDLIGFPIDNKIVDVDYLDIIDFIPSKTQVQIYNQKVKVRGGKEYNRYIPIDYNFCKFLGLYVADGSAELGQGVSVTQHIDENNQTLIQKIFNSFRDGSFKYKFYPTRKAIGYTCSSVIHSNMFFLICKAKEYKQLPEWTVYLPHTKQLSILQGLCLGDGHYDKKHNNTIYTTISAKLAWQIQQILHRLKIVYRIELIPPKNIRCHPSYRIIAGGNLQNGTTLLQNYSTSIYIDDYLFRQIKNIKHANCTAYRISQNDDNTSYCTPLCAVIHE